MIVDHEKDNRCVKCGLILESEWKFNKQYEMYKCKCSLATKREGETE